MAAYLDAAEELPLASDADLYLGGSWAPAPAQVAAGPPFDGEELIRSGNLVLPALRGMVLLDQPWRARLERYAELSWRADVDTLALHVEPLG